MQSIRPLHAYCWGVLEVQDSDRQMWLATQLPELHCKQDTTARNEHQHMQQRCWHVGCAERPSKSRAAKCTGNSTPVGVQLAAGRYIWGAKLQLLQSTGSTAHTDCLQHSTCVQVCLGHPRVWWVQVLTCHLQVYPHQRAWHLFAGFGLVAAGAAAP